MNEITLTYPKTVTTITITKTITKEWLNAHSTERGGYTKSQITAIGVPWPAPKNWKRDVIGREVSLESAKIFEKKAERSLLEKCIAMCKKLNARDKRGLVTAIVNDK